MADGNTKEYQAKSPELIFSNIEKQTIENINVLKRTLTYDATGRERVHI